MDTAALITHLADEGARLAAAARRAGFDAPVPSLDWDVRGLVTHLGCVHRWAAVIVGGGSQDEIDAAGADDVRPPDAELLAWFDEGLAGIVAALRAAPDDLQVFTFLRTDSARHFWARRQAHETAIHRLDAEGAAGLPTVFDAALAHDGIEELLAFARGRPFAIPHDACLALRTEEGREWLLRFGGERTLVTADPAPADVQAAELTVAGSASEVYRWVWNRPSAAEVRGDSSLAQEWAQRVRITR